MDSNVSLSFIYLFLTTLTKDILKMYNNFMKSVKKMSNRRGFTLVELVVSIAILAILCTLVGISASFFTKRANEKAQQTAIETAYNSVQSVLVEKNSGFSTYGSLYEACQSVLGDSVKSCEQYSNNETYRAPSATESSDKNDGYYIVFRRYVPKDESGNSISGSAEWRLDLLYYLKEGNLWSYKEGVLYKNDVPVS